MRSFLLAPTLFALAITSTLAQKTENVLIPDPRPLWHPAPKGIPPGAQIACITGDPGLAGPFIVLLKFPPRYKVPAHYHPVDEDLTVISGTVYFGEGERPDQGAARLLKPGAYIWMPANMRHFGWTTTQTVVVQVRMTGPLKTAYVNPADDPRKGKEGSLGEEPVCK